MPRSKARAPGKSHQVLQLSRASIKKENRRRFLQLVQAARQNRPLLKQLASLNDSIPEKLPAALLREMKAAAKRASKRGVRKNLLAGRG